MSIPRPLIVGIGGTTRAGSSSEKALQIALKAAEAGGAQTRLYGGAFLAKLPVFDPKPGNETPEQLELAAAVKEADGIIISTPGYHGSVSGVIKNALDTLELTRPDGRIYFDGRPVGIIVTGDGWQTAGTCLVAVRTIIHAMRGWPTPMGAALNGGSATLFNEAGDECLNERDGQQLKMVADQVLDFARMRAAADALAGS